jgi:hypothetical protein
MKVLMNCEDVLDAVYESAGEEPRSLAFQLGISLHLLCCPRCAAELKKLELFYDVLETDFLPAAPGVEDTVMKTIAAQGYEENEEALDAPAGFSFRGWVITGCFILLSFSTVFFSMDFINVANAEGSSFLLPVGLTIGVVLTSYGALFIGSHLKELSNRFRLR